MESLGVNWRSLIIASLSMTYSWKDSFCGHLLASIFCIATSWNNINLPKWLISASPSMIHEAGSDRTILGQFLLNECANNITSSEAPWMRPILSTHWIHNCAFFESASLKSGICGAKKDSRRAQETLPCQSIHWLKFCRFRSWIHDCWRVCRSCGVHRMDNLLKKLLLLLQLSHNWGQTLRAKHKGFSRRRFVNLRNRGNRGRARSIMMLRGWATSFIIIELFVGSCKAEQNHSK